MALIRYSTRACARRQRSDRTEWPAKPYGLRSAFDVFTVARRYSLARVVGQITTPLLIADLVGEQFWAGLVAAVVQRARRVTLLVALARPHPRLEALRRPRLQDPFEFDDPLSPMTGSQACWACPT
jgi:hypothetical protein